MLSKKYFLASGETLCVSSVSTKPGATAFTNTLREASSFATDLVKPIIPALEAEQLDWPLLPFSPTTLVMLMTRPQRRLIMPRAAYLVIRNVPLRSVSTPHSQSASVIRNNNVSLVNPALFTSTSICPKSFSTDFANASTWDATPTSHAYP